MTPDKMISIDLYENLRMQYDLRLAEINHLRDALETIRQMAIKRKSLIRMPDGRMLDNFCFSALSRGR